MKYELKDYQRKRLLKITLNIIKSKLDEINKYVDEGDYLSATTILDCTNADWTIACELSASLTEN